MTRNKTVPLAWGDKEPLNFQVRLPTPEPLTAGLQARAAWGTGLAGVFMVQVIPLGTVPDVACVQVVQAGEPSWITRSVMAALLLLVKVKEGRAR